MILGFKTEASLTWKKEPLGIFPTENFMKQEK